MLSLYLQYLFILANGFRIAFGLWTERLNSVTLRKVFLLSQVQFFHLNSRNKVYSLDNQHEF